jgi:hypothetical protein
MNSKNKAKNKVITVLYPKKYKIPKVLKQSYNLLILLSC